MLGTKINKPIITQEQCNQYAQVAEWCNANNAHIEDKGECYEVVENVEPTLTIEEIKANLLSAVDNYLNITVQERGYDNILSACTYAYSTDEIFKAEGEKALAWRDKVYRKCYDILAQVENGERDIPSQEELISELPTLEW